MCVSFAVLLRGLALAALASSALGEEVPKWLLAGVLQVETGSTYVRGVVNYVHKGGPDLGPFQVGRISVVRLKRAGLLPAGYSGTVLETDMREAERVARILMLDLYRNEARGDWFVVASMWKHGPTGYKRNRADARERAQRIKNVGTKLAHTVLH